MNLEADIECSECKRKVKIPVKDMVPGRSKRCPGCNTEFKFNGDDGRKAQKALDDFEKSVKDLFK